MLVVVLFFLDFTRDEMDGEDDPSSTLFPAFAGDEEKGAAAAAEEEEDDDDEDACSIGKESAIFEGEDNTDLFKAFCQICDKTIRLGSFLEIQIRNFAF